MVTHPSIDFHRPPFLTRLTGYALSLSQVLKAFQRLIAWLLKTPAGCLCEVWFGLSQKNICWHIRNLQNKQTCHAWEVPVVYCHHIRLSWMVIMDLVVPSKPHKSNVLVKLSLLVNLQLYLCKIIYFLHPDSIGFTAAVYLKKKECRDWWILVKKGCQGEIFN